MRKSSAISRLPAASFTPHRTESSANPGERGSGGADEEVNLSKNIGGWWLRRRARGGSRPATLSSCRGPRTQAAVCPQHPLSGPVAQATVPRALRSRRGGNERLAAAVRRVSCCAGVL